MAIAVNATRRASGQAAMGFFNPFVPTFTSTPTDLATLILSVMFFGDATTVASVSDPHGNVWSAVADSGNHGTGVRTAIWVCHSQAGLVSGDSITVFCNDNLFITASWAIDEVTGLGSAHLPDVTAAAFSNSNVSAFSIGPTGATTYANALVWAVIGTNIGSGTTQAITAGTGYTQQGSRVTGSAGSLYVEYKVVAATGAQTADGAIDTTASKYIGIVAVMPEPQTADRGGSFTAVEAAHTTLGRSGSFAGAEAAYAVGARGASFVGVEVAYSEGTPPPPAGGRRPSIIVA